MPNSVLEAIRMGIWNFEPQADEPGQFKPTCALPGSGEKVNILAERLRRGLPLWHPEDRLTFDEAE